MLPGGMANWRQAPITVVMSVRPSVCSHVVSSAPKGRFCRTFIWAFSKKNPNIDKVGENVGDLK
jgi:hypothetical protein